MMKLMSSQSTLSLSGATGLASPPAGGSFLPALSQGPDYVASPHADAGLAGSGLRFSSAELSSVQPIETTAELTIPTDYLAWRTRHCEVEWQRALELYCHTDGIEGTHRAEQFVECRNYAWFARHKETGKVRVVSNACRLRWCPVCAIAKTNTIHAEVSDWLRGVRSPKFLTLTSKHTSASLAAQIAALYKHFRLFRQHKQISRVIRGGIWFFQLKRSGPRHEWHPHLHCVLDADYISQRLLSIEWQRTTGDSFVVDIRAVKSERKVVNYVSRYCARPAKLADFESPDAIEMFTVLHGKRLCGSFGSGREVSMRPRRCEDFTEWERFGSWSYVVSNRRNDSGCRQILKAFFTNTACPRETLLSSWPKPNYGPSTEDTSKKTIEDRQLRFQEFR